LIISGPSEESTDKYGQDRQNYSETDQDIDSRSTKSTKTARLPKEGVSKCERLLRLGNLYDPTHMEIIHHVYQALRAHTLYKIDVDYVNKDAKS